MSRALFVAVVACTLGVSGTACSGLNGNNLLESCEAEGTGAAMCQGYIVGTSDAFSVGKLVCVPEGVDGRQEVDIVKLWLRTHPEKRHLQAIALVATALKETFPCN
jgi:hypothetical protein